MEKLIHKITIGDWDYFTNTGEVSSLKKYKVNSRNVQKLIEIVTEKMNGKLDLTKDSDNLGSKFKIQELKILRSSLVMLMAHSLKIEAMMLELKLEFKPDPDIEKAIKDRVQEIKDKFHFEVNQVEDLKMLDTEIARRELKYKEMNIAPVEIKTMTFSESMLTIFNTLGYDKIDYSMVLSHFFILKDKAIKLNGTTK